MIFSSKDQDRFWSKVDKQFLGCWLWTDSLITYGYGQFKLKRKHTKPHRISYEMFYGTIPEGKQLDHLCRVRHCVNPDHLEVVTIGENVRRGEGVAAKNMKKTHCPKGHPLSGDNLISSTMKYNGTRSCRTCANESQKIRARNRRLSAGK